MGGYLTYLQEIGWRCELDRSGPDRWPAFVNAVMNFRVP